MGKHTATPRKYSPTVQKGGVDDPIVPPHIVQAIIENLKQEVYSYVTIGFEDDDDIPLSQEDFESLLYLPEMTDKLRLIVNDLVNEYIADNESFPFYGDAYRELLANLGVYQILDRYRISRDDNDS